MANKETHQSTQKDSSSTVMESELKSLQSKIMDLENKLCFTAVPGETNNVDEELLSIILDPSYDKGAREVFLAVFGGGKNFVGSEATLRRRWGTWKLFWNPTGRWKARSIWRPYSKRS